MELLPAASAGWLTFLRSLTARGLSGVRLVTSDAHPGLVAGIGPGGTDLDPAPQRGPLLILELARGRHVEPLVVDRLDQEALARLTGDDGLPAVTAPEDALAWT